MVMARRKKTQDRGKSLVGFRVGGIDYASDILRVREILNPLPVVSFPHVESSILGVADHRGEVIPVLDVRRRFGLEAAGRTQTTKWVVVSVPGRHIALVVDAVTEVFGTGDAQDWDSRMPDVGETSRGVKAVYRKSGGEKRGALVFVLDIDRVVEPVYRLGDVASQRSGSSEVGL